MFTWWKIISRAPEGASRLVPGCVLSLSVFSTKSRSATGLAEDFQERRGVNVKTNDSGCKECDTEEGRVGLVEGEKGAKGREGGGEEEHPRTTRLQGWLQPPGRWQFLFISLSLAQAFDFYFSRPCHFFNLPSSPLSLPRGGYFQIPFAAVHGRCT